MAFSGPFHKGQIPVNCQLCEESHEIKWKCLQCDFLLCTKCQKLHKKVKSTDKHDIVDIKDIAAYQQQSENNPNFGNIKRSDHNGQRCCFFCQDCEDVVCPLCIVKTHNKHNMVEIGESYMFLGIIKTFNFKLEQEMTRLAKDMSTLDLIKSSENSKYEHEKEKILSHDEALKNAVDRQTETLLSDLHQRWDTLEKSMINEENIVKQVSHDLESRCKKLNEALDSNNPNKVLETVKEERQLMKQYVRPVITKYKELPEFVPKEINQSDIENIHGILKDVSGACLQIQTEFQIMKQYTTRLASVSNLVCCADESLWINHFSTSTLQSIKPTKVDSLTINKAIKLHVFNMAITPTEDLLISTTESSLQILSNTTGKLQTSHFSVSPLITTAVHVSRDNKVIVGARESKRAFPVNGPRQVIVMNLAGRKERTYHLDNNTPIFTNPIRITSDSRNNIYVIDTVSDNRDGRVVLLGQKGAIRIIYSGNADINKKKSPFRPNDLVTTKSDNIIISDHHNQILHVLNTEGQCIKYLNTKALGIDWPISLYTDNRELLFIGCNTYKNQPDEAKIFVVKFSGF